MVGWVVEAEVVPGCDGGWDRAIAVTTAVGRATRRGCCRAETEEEETFDVTWGGWGRGWGPVWGPYQCVRSGWGEAWRFTIRGATFRGRVERFPADSKMCTPVCGCAVGYTCLDGGLLVRTGVSKVYFPYM